MKKNKIINIEIPDKKKFKKLKDYKKSTLLNTGFFPQKKKNKKSHSSGGFSKSENFDSPHFSPDLENSNSSLNAQNLLDSDFEEEIDNKVISNPISSGDAVVTSPYSPDEIELTEFEILFYKKCPICQTKVRHSRVYREGNRLIQEFKCKKKDCVFEKKIILEL